MLSYWGFIWDYDGSIWELLVEWKVVSAETWMKVTRESDVPTEGEWILITPWKKLKEETKEDPSLIDQSSWSPLWKETYNYTEKNEEDPN